MTQKHATDPSYGTEGEHYLEMVVELAHVIKASSILDYGCGKGTLLEALDGQYEGDIVLQGYDPAITKFGLDPECSDLVVCTNVLEHIEPDCVQAVLSHIRSLTTIGAFFVIDGSIDFWFTQIARFFHLEKVQKLGENSFAACCVPWSATLIEKLKHNATPITDDELEIDLQNRVKAAEAVDGKVQCHGMLGRFKI